ncbi:hypothetical protein A2870_04410 [Candidatus Curtissbacteria bacterium RIFCSPHIGHO2_01_FULL_41_11]|uniref:Glucosamine/galactosamine-6-phosphate isomerase domain-containing protein n=1 Tax=Candidatus Curtissbacteria bacterium RIFCSPHIGHO2_01_FULL_41_11 TaxID=1797711 RepID=A0A1F5G597_9BACT|nr:MAG: hypothetical protein A2870_04410 [Candidatus Curtissbacteria bacterium RIFCSPHIGHO2_01_FULL_41_11]
MIDLIRVKNKEEGNKKAHDILKKLVDRQTLLALSGGSSVDYRAMLVDPDDVVPGAICVVDERYGAPFHKDSNELLLKNAGVKEFADKHCVESVKILTGQDFLESGKIYEKAVRNLLSRFAKRVGVMGVGEDLHTAGIFPFSAAAKSPDYVASEVVDGRFPKRITLTLKALGEFQTFIILMFGAAKREALRIMLDEKENDMQKYPAIFFRKSKIRSYLITDQNI